MPDKDSKGGETGTGSDKSRTERQTEAPEKKAPEGFPAPKK